MRAIVSVATGHYAKGLDRLTEWCAANDQEYFTWRDKLPAGSPTHQDVPYAFKAHALRSAQAAGARTLLWADACILPIQPLEPLWERIERDGYFISNQAGPGHAMAWSNYEWTGDSAYADLFPVLLRDQMLGPKSGGGVHDPLEMRRVNAQIPHVVATTFGISLDHPTGRAILDEYFRLASETKVFCGPWTNQSYGHFVFVPGRDMIVNPDARCHPCGPPDVRGHRHDQTALSVIAWRLGCQLTPLREVFSYRGNENDETILVADGSYGR